MSQIARISGPLLASNLVRTQSDLAFETDLLHIGSSNTRIGVLTNSPTDLVQVLGQAWCSPRGTRRWTSPLPAGRPPCPVIAKAFSTW